MIQQQKKSGLISRVQWGQESTLVNLICFTLCGTISLYLFKYNNIMYLKSAGVVFYNYAGTIGDRGGGAATAQRDGSIYSRWRDGERERERDPSKAGCWSCLFFWGGSKYFCVPCAQRGPCRCEYTNEHNSNDIELVHIHVLVIVRLPR